MTSSSKVGRWFLSLDEATEGLNFPEEIKKELVLLEVPYFSFDAEVQTGQLVLHAALADDIQKILSELVAARFPLEKVVPIVAYNWDDEKSMQDNNTSAFNYRKIIGTDTVSNHSLGRAIDINPLLNPYYARDGKTYPIGSSYEPDVLGTITYDSDIVRIFKSHGWTWLGERAEYPDYQHFEKSGV